MLHAEGHSLHTGTGHTRAPPVEAKTKTQEVQQPSVQQALAQKHICNLALAVVCALQTMDLVAYASGAATDLSWPQPSFRPTVKQALAMETHIAIFGMAGQGQGNAQAHSVGAAAAAAFASSGGGGGGAGRSAAAAAAWEQLVQRPELSGRHADRVGRLMYS